MLVKWGCVSLSGGQKVASCSRGPERACLSLQLITPSSPSPCPVKFSTLWEAPTSASWWTCTVSRVQTLLSWVGLWWYVCVRVAIFVSICLKSHTAFILILRGFRVLCRMGYCIICALSSVQFNSTMPRGICFQSLYINSTVNKNRINI